MGPFRRPSASTGMISASSGSAASSSRVHRTHESQHHPVGSHSLSSLATSVSPQQRIVQVLVNRLKNKLPCYSGMALHLLEADDATRQVIDALVDLSKDSLDIIGWVLTEQVDRLSQQTDLNGHHRIEVLQSQLFLLKVLSVAMASRWSTGFRSNSRASNANHQGSDSPAPSLRPSRLTEYPGTPPPWSEPPPLDDNCAKYILSVMVLLLRQTASSDVSALLSARYSDITFRDFETCEPASALDLEDYNPTILTHISDVQVLRSRPSTSSVRSDSSSIPLSSDSTVYEKTHMSTAKSSYAVLELIAKYTGRIIFYISASNWPVVFSRIRSKIRLLASQSQDENADTLDLHILSHSALDRARLVQVLGELSSLLINFNIETQKAIAPPLRMAVWNWVDRFPNEFNESLRTRGGMGGSPERTFDQLYSRVQGNERTLWPVLTILSCLSQDRLASDMERAARVTTNVRFGEEIVRHWRAPNSKLSWCSLVAAVELCRAAMYIQPDNEADIHLRMLSSDVVHEIRTELVNHPSRKPPWELTQDLDVPVYAEALVSVFRFLPEDETIPIFQAFVEPERSEAVKMIAVRAALTLVQEAARFPWQKSLEPLEEALGPRLRDIFRTACVRRTELDQFGNMKRIAMRPKALKKPHEHLSDREILLLGILALWQAGPTFFMRSLRDGETHTWISSAVKMWESPIDPAVKISSSTTTRLIASLVFSIPPTDPSLPSMAFTIKKGLSATLLSVAHNLLHARNDVELQRLWTTIALQLLELYTRKSDLDHVKEIQLDFERMPAFILTELAFVATLPCVDTGVSQLAARGLRVISYAERMPGAPLLPFTEEEIAKRHPIYDQIGDPRITVVGRLGHQKRIRKLLRVISNTSGEGAAVLVWQECYWRWRALTELVTVGHEDTPDSMTIRRNRVSGTLEEWRHQWQNLTLWLAALADCCFDSNLDVTLLGQVIPLHVLPDEMRRVQDPVRMVDKIVDDLTRLLMNGDMHIRDIAKEALGAELVPRLYPSLLKKLETTFQRLIQQEALDDQKAVMYIDQFLSVVKLILDNPYLPLEQVMSIDVSNTLFDFASFISRISTMDTFRIRVKFCSLCENVCSSSGILTLRKDSVARHNILDIVVSWIQHTETVAPEWSSLQLELNLACLKAIVKLLERLQLRPLDSSTGDDSVHVISRLFNRYSGILLDGLQHCLPDLAPSDSVSELGSIQQRMKASAREAELRELIISGLSHLVSANSEIGFKQCLPLAYHEDTRKRSIFAHVFARVIGQGTKFTPMDRSAAIMKHSRLSELLKQSDMTLAVAVCEVCPPSEVDVIISVLLNIFDTRASLMALVKVMIDHEVARTENEAAFFRGNTTCTRFLSAFARIHGYNYLRSLVIPLIKCMEDMPSGYELDPNKAPGQDVVDNRKNIEFIAESFLEIIGASPPALPSMFREICAHITEVVVDVWPNSKFAALGAFMFLRFISPAIVAPETIDIEPPSDSLRRGLMLITKIIQNLANNVFFGKEAHMIALNDFLRDHIADVTRFLTEINTYSPGEDDDDSDEWLGTASDDTDLIVLHRFFHNHADKIGKELLSITGPSAEGETSSISGKRAWDGLCTLLVDLGPPLEVPRPSTLSSSEHEEFKALLERFGPRSTEQVQDLFCEVDIPSNHEGLFIFKLSKVDVEAIDIELMMFHILKTIAASPRNGCFDLIVDCTALQSNSEIPVRWLKYCAELVPLDIRQRFSRAYIINGNTMTHKYLRRIYNLSAGASFFDDIVPISSVRELVDELPDAQHALHLLSEPVSLEQEISERFTEVTMKVGHLRVPVVLMIGSSHIRITSIRKMSISPSLSCKATEIIHLTDIGDVYKVSTAHDIANEFIIRRHRTGSTVYFTSPSRDIVVKAIRTAKGRLKDARAPLAERFSRFSNVAATLLHAGLINIYINDEELRASAYELLGAVCTYLNYDKNAIIVAKAGFVPGDLNSFAIQTSERIAEFAPHLTLDFISEVSAAINVMEKKPVDQLGERIGSLHYLSPWIKNLAQFCIPTSPLYERSGARVRDCIRALCELTIASPELITIMQQNVWSEVGKLDALVVDVVLDELTRSAADAGIGSFRCETVAYIIAALSSIHVRGRLVSKLRKAIIKASPSLSRSLVDNPNWGEVCALVRLTLIAGYQRHPSHNNLYVPEIIHIVTLIAGLGSTLVRKSVYGIIITLIQSLYFARSELAPAPELLHLSQLFAQEEIVRLFGLQRTTPTSEYSSYDPPNDQAHLDNQESLAKLFSQVLAASAGTNGLLNVWRARWMGLATASAFQYSSVIQMRSFTALGSLALSDVDDDFMYQMMVAFKTALAQSNENDTSAVVSMLRCFTKVIPALQRGSRHLPYLFWISIAFLQTGHFAFYAEATRLSCMTLEEMEKQGYFIEDTVSAVLLNSRSDLEEIAVQLDQILGLSFDSNFSFALAAVVFKGIRQSSLKEFGEKLLRTALDITVRSRRAIAGPNGHSECVSPDILGYVMALLPLSTTPKLYRRLLKAAHMETHSSPERGATSYDDDNSVPHVTISVLGVNDSTTALLVTSFIASMLSTAQGDDSETEILYSVLAEIAAMYPEIISIAYDSLQDRIRDCFANSTNSAIICYASDILRVAVQDNTRFTSLRGSASTLNTLDDGSVHGPGTSHLNALEEIGMQGIVMSFVFVQGGHATKVIQWIPELVNLIVTT